jgi:predicted adenine nucleotide alpha hydrolase (AANH) superfamily ATPase
MEKIMKKNKMKQDVILHICCGPCATYSIEHLNNNNYNITGYFYNPNIEPVEEYEKRLNTFIQYLDNVEINDLFVDDYDNEKWRDFVIEYKNEPEGGKRCEKCIEYRLKKTAEFCKKRKIKKFTTTLSISPHKNFEFIKKTGEQIAEKNGLEFLPFDFKKNNGFKKSVEISKKYNMYRQKYCGCLFSMRTTIF